MDGNTVASNAPALTVVVAAVAAFVVPPLFLPFNRKKVQATTKKEMTTKANLIEENSHQ